MKSSFIILWLQYGVLNFCQIVRDLIKLFLCLSWLMFVQPVTITNYFIQFNQIENWFIILTIWLHMIQTFMQILESLI